MLPFESFMQIVAHTPLVAIDLLIENAQGEILLGLRKNQPAAGSWFVPGGRILKNERLDDAFRRVTRSELGVQLERDSATWLGTYEHFYDSNAGKIPGVSTHYVVLAYKLNIADTDQLQLPLGSQHDDYRWATPEAIQRDPRIHPYCQAYFKTEIPHEPELFQSL